MELTDLANYFFISGDQALLAKRISSLDQDDIETIVRLGSWDDVHESVLKDAPRQVLLIRPALENFKVSLDFLVLLNENLIWGALACLLQRTIQANEPETLEKVPQMIKQLVDDAETLKGLCGSATEWYHFLEDACYDMEKLYLGFFITSINFIRNPGQAGHDLKVVPPCGRAVHFIEKQYDSTLQDLKEVLARVEPIPQSLSDFQVRSLQPMGDVVLAVRPTLPNGDFETLDTDFRALNARFTTLDAEFRFLCANSLWFMGILSFLMPDQIPLELFEHRDEQQLPYDLRFCSNMSSLEDVRVKLCSSGLISVDIDKRTITISRRVQTEFKQYLSQHGRQRCFNNVVMLIHSWFPSDEPSKGQLYDRWARCYRYFRHVLNLKDSFSEETRASEKLEVSWEFCYLLSSCQRFLSEMSEMTEVQQLCEVNLSALDKLEDGPKKTDLMASIISHQAQAAESLGDPVKAIELNTKGYELRLHENPPQKILLCHTANNLGYCYSTANLHEDAEKWFEKSREWWETMVKAGEETRDRPAWQVANHARCLLYLGRYEQAKKMFENSIHRLETEKPRNWAMLGYAWFGLATLNRRQGDFKAAEAHYVKAQNSWIEGDENRTHPFYAACIYKVGVCCLDQGKFKAALDHLWHAHGATSERALERPVEHARTVFKISEALLRDPTSWRGEARRKEAENILKRSKPGVVRCATEGAYDKFISIFWR